MTDRVYYVVNFDGTPILHTERDEDEPTPIAFSSDDAAYQVRNWLRREVMHEYLEHGATDAYAEKRADSRVTVLKHRVER